MTSLKKFVAKYNGNLTDKETAYLTNFKLRMSISYSLPKVHKPEVIEEQTELQNKEYVTSLESQDLNLRPIVAGPQCPYQATQYSVGYYNKASHDTCQKLYRGQS